MKSLLTIPFTVFSFWLAAQAPVNDDCAGIIDLGEVPFCSAAAQYTNVNATTSTIDIPSLNIPACFNNNAERDVWFQFTLPANGSITDVTISVWGNVAGNGTMQMPEVALYRGDCMFGALSELLCAAAPLNVNEVHLDVLHLDAGTTYFLRINDYSATGTPNAGTFKLCVEAYVADFNMGEFPGAQSCSGTLWDSGGETGQYSTNENLTFTICPQDFHQCLQINIVDYFTEPVFDVLRIYEGSGTSGTLLADFDGAGGNVQLNVEGGGCATVQFQSDGSVQSEGFQLTWQCSPEECPAPPPIPPSASNCDGALSINSCSTELPVTITLAPGMGDPAFIVDGVNAGCIAGPSQDLNFSFFYFQAQADGNFGFLVQNGDPNNPSDIDFNVWGPIDDAANICEFVSTHQPVRSSWTAAPDADNPDGWTGLTDTNPYNGSPVTDEFDCGSPATPGQGFLPTDDSFVKTLDVLQGQIYVVLLDDYDGAVESANGISILFNGTASGVLDPIPGETVSVPDDVMICPGQSTQLVVIGGLDYAWSPGATLSCDDCPNPIALPSEPTTYLVQIATTCALIEDSVTVSFLDLNLGPDANVCVGASFVLNENAIPGTYEWFGSPGLDCYTCATPTFTATSPGIFILGCVITTPFCSDTDFIKINVAAGVQPEINILADTAICAGDMITLGAPGNSNYNYMWTANPPNFAPNPPTDPNPPAFAPTGSATYYLEVISPACFFHRKDSVVVDVYARPVLDLIGGASICLGDSVELGNTPYQADVTYAWTPNDGSFIDTTAANPTMTPQTQGTHIYTVNAANPGCSVQESVTVVATDVQLSLSTADTIYLCKGSSKQITAAIVPGYTPGVTTVTWSPLQNIQISPDGLVATVAPEDTITYTVTLTVLGAPCGRIKKVFVKVDSLPQFLGIEPLVSTICLGAIDTLHQPEGEPLYEPYLFPDMTFEWIPTDGLISSPYEPFAFSQPTDTVVYKRVATNGGCSDTLVVTINVIIPPVVTATPLVSTICQDSFAVLVAHAPAYDSLVWAPANSLSCDTCFMTTATPQSSMTYTLTAFFNGCPASADPVTVTVNPKPVYDFPDKEYWCLGEVITLNLLNDPSVTTYTWTSNPPGMIPPDAQPDITLDIVGVEKPVTYYLEAFNGCYARDSFKIFVTGDTLTISDPDTLCPKMSKLLNAAATIGGGQYLWSTGATAQAVFVTPDATTTYTVTYNLNGCAFQDSVEIVVQGETPDVLFPSDIALCPGETVVLNTVETMDADYTWSADAPGFPFHGAFPGPQIPTETTTYTVTATSADGCVLVDSVTVTVFDSTLIIPENQITVCAGEPFFISATGLGNPYSYTWTLGNSVASILPSFYDTLFTQQTAAYNLEYQYGIPGNFCFLHETVTVTVLPTFTIKIVAEPDSTISAGEPVMLDAVIQPSQNVNGFTFEWLENNTTPVGNTQQITITPMTDDTIISYTVKVTPPNGCSQSATVDFLVVQPKVKIPNAFTPNGDGANDVFQLAVIEGIVIVERLEIFNRWGEKIYESTDPAAYWDGRADGKDAPSDVYIYKVRWRRGDGSLAKPESGEVTLLR